MIAKIKIESNEFVDDATSLVRGDKESATTARLNEIYTAIFEGAESFLRAEYTVCGYFVAIFATVIFCLISWGTGWNYTRGF